LIKHLLYIVPTLAALWFVDDALSKHRTAGWERNSVINSQKRWNARGDFDVVLLGSSTSADWLPPAELGRVLGVPRERVLDAHINGCHQDCTYAEVRRLLAEGRHFKTAVFGTNLFQLCEFDNSKRVLQQHMMLPKSDIPRLFGLYLQMDQPLRNMMRFVGNELSGAYADTQAIQDAMALAVFGKRNDAQKHRWVRKQAPAAKSSPTCSYEPDAIAYKKALSEAILDDLGKLADEVYLLVLPDVTLDDPTQAEAWTRHRALHQSFADARPYLKVIDLSHDGAHAAKHFRDGFHLSPEGIRIQQALFARRMNEAEPVVRQ
jgi:hypothetical protein